MLSLWLGAVALEANELSLGSLFADGAVLQQGQVVPIWGEANPHEKITVAFLDAMVSAQADETGHWVARIGPLAAGKSGALEVTGAQAKLRRVDIITGDVWLCSGQSNMQLTMRLATAPGVVIADAVYPSIREFKVDIQVSAQPASHVWGRWFSANGTTVADFSAAAFYFAREIHQRTGIPIGLVVSAKGGAPIEAWLTPKVLANEAQARVLRNRWTVSLGRWKPAPKRVGGLLPVEAVEQDMSALGPGGYGEPGVLYNGMIAPLVPYAIRGILWYQGEANTSRDFVPPAEYGFWFRSVISSWRDEWGANVPFYFVQLPSNNLPERDFSGKQWATLREEQGRALALPNTGMVVTIDLGQPELIHPTNKEPVGHRLALLAAKRTYGLSGNDDVGPIFRRVVRAGSKATVEFDHAEGLTTRDGRPPRGLEIRRQEGAYAPAEAAIENGTVVLMTVSGDEPIGIRYAWKQNPGDANLVNGAGLPAGPFSCDEIQE